MKKSIYLLFAFMVFSVSAFSQSVGIENTKVFLEYVIPKLPAKATRADLANVLKTAPASVKAKKDVVIAELRELDDSELAELAKLTKSTPAGVQSAATYLLSLLPSESADAIISKLKINVRDFGARGDGITDDYPAFRKAVDKINESGTGELFIPAGIYYINQYYVTANEKKSGKLTGYYVDFKGKRTLASNPSLTFVNVKGLKISGEKGSVVKVKGDFNRSGYRQMDGYILSGISAIPALNLVSCIDVMISDLEIAGGIEKTTRDSGVNESGSGNLVKFTSCKNVKLDNLYIHHGQTDGLNFASSKGDRNENFTITNVRSYYNARQGVTLGNLAHSTFKNCEFSHTGTLSYRHAPGAGLDVEPNVGGTWPKGFRNEDVQFIDCKFEGNSAGALRLSHVGSSNDIRFVGCEITAWDSAVNNYFIIVNTQNVLFDNCKIDAGKNTIYAAWQNKASSAIFKNCFIKGSEKTIIAQPSGSTSHLTFENCTIEYYGKTDNAIFPHIRMKNASFINNTLIYPAKLKKWRKLVEVGNQSGTKIIRK